MPLLKRVETEQPLKPALLRMSSRLRSLSKGSARLINDVHSQLNRTRVSAIIQPDSIEALRAIIKRARARGQMVSIAGGRHAMGGQQFVTDGVLLDMSRMNRVLGFNPARREVEVEAGIQWPQLMEYLVEAQKGRSVQWGVIQKQTGADSLSLGGALAANIHGRGLGLKPIIDDVEAFVLVDAEGRTHRCSRQENRELFRLAIGGYGLFGVIAHVTLRLQQRRKLERIVRVADLHDLMASFEERIRDGFLYGDFQFMTDKNSDTFLSRGIFSCYRPAASNAAAVPASQRELSFDDWKQLLYLAHTDRKRAFEV
jgi:FAD/FMN-containing dehydrogenase